jgi:CheY-like chemotaxis protein
MEEQKKILVVEDDLFLRDIYTEVLTNAGFAVDAAEDGQKGLEKIRKGGWDLVLLDIIMPVMSGVDVMHKLREEYQIQQKTYYKKLVFLTNLDNDKEIKEALQFGDGYLIKSQLTPGDMLNEVKLYLAPNK